MPEKETIKQIIAEVVEKIGVTTVPGESELKEIIDSEICIYSRRRYISLKEKIRLSRQVYATLCGAGVLQELLDDKTITEIMVNGPDNIFVEREGKLERTNLFFENEACLNDLVQRIAADSNRVINEASPIVDARMKDGSRVNIVLPPVSLTGPAITIRKFSQEVMSVEKLIEIGSLSEETAEFLEKLVKANYNIFVSGGTGSGKTTFLNALSGFIPKDQRIITIEDSAELQIKSVPNLISLEVRNANVEGCNAITVRELIKTALRMRPDRLIVGEVRDAACVDMLQALNTGHTGMSTGHANSARDMLVRLEAMVLLGADIPLAAVRRQIASAIDIIIQLGRLRDRTRKVVEITEVAGFEQNEIVLNPLFRYSEKGVKNGKILGVLEKTENRLIRTEKLTSAGYGDMYNGSAD